MISKSHPNVNSHIFHEVYHACLDILLLNSDWGDCMLGGHAKRNLEYVICALLFFD